ncbi:hypothetical protein, partial [Pseudomonas aeruginosa]
SVPRNYFKPYSPHGSGWSSCPTMSSRRALAYLNWSILIFVSWFTSFVYKDAHNNNGYRKNKKFTGAQCFIIDEHRGHLQHG